MSRPRGFIDYWKPRADTQQLIANSQTVLATYAAYGPMTVRQVFYRLVATKGYAKTEKAYKSLAEVLQKARRARMISFSEIRDDGDTTLDPIGYTGLTDVMDAIRYTVNNYSLRASLFQPKRIVIMTEASGMAPMIAQTAHRYGVTVLSAGGFNGVTGKHALAESITDAWDDEGRKTVVLHVGDYDPSGEHIYSNLEEDVTAFLDDMIYDEDAENVVSFERIAVTEEQIVSLNLPAAPAKATDDRSFNGVNGDGTSTVQCEAIDPATLSQIVEDAILRHWDEEAAKAVIETETQEQQILKDWMERAGEP